MSKTVGAIALVALGLGTAVAAPNTSVKAGIEAWQRSDYAAAVGIWRPLADKGDADAAFNLGQAYRLGRGVPSNLAIAQTWLERAARKGHVDAQTTLGLMLYDLGNRVAALRWLKSAAEQGEPRALLIDGTALFNGESVSRNAVLAYAYVSRAAAQGLEPAQKTLSEMDRMLPLDQRLEGVALAQAKVAVAVKIPAPAPEPPKSSKPAAKAPAKIAAKVLPKTTPPAAAATGAWRAQLGAFSKRASAEALITKLSGAGPLAGLQPFYVDAGVVTRLQVGPFESRAAATAACSALAKAGQPCFVVQAK
jgi:cell division septation protein DedD